MESLDWLLTVEDLAEYLEVPVATVYAWRYRNVGPPGFRVGKHLRFRRSDVEHWIDDRIAQTRHSGGETMIGGQTHLPDRASHRPRGTEDR